MASVRENLIAAKSLISTPMKWHRGSMRGHECWCAMGAVADVIKADGRAGWISDTPEYQALRLALPKGFSHVPTYNDCPYTSYEDIMALFQRAIDAQPE